MTAHYQHKLWWFYIKLRNIIKILQSNTERFTEWIYLHIWLKNVDMIYSVQKETFSGNLKFTLSLPLCKITRNFARNEEINKAFILLLEMLKVGLKLLSHSNSNQHKVGSTFYSLPLLLYLTPHFNPLLKFFTDKPHAFLWSIRNSLHIT